MQSYKNARYEEAIEHFKTAVSLDPSLLNARIYLATAYAQQYVPGAETAENKRYAEQAIEEYKKVLTIDPGNINSVKGIAYLYLQEKRFDDAKQYYNKAVQIDPNDPESYYSVAFIDWSEAYKFRQEERNKLGMKATDLLKDKKVCELVKAHNAPLVEEGIALLNKSLQLRRTMTTPWPTSTCCTVSALIMSATIRLPAPPTSRPPICWVDKTIATKKEKANKQGAGGIVMDQQK